MPSTLESMDTVYPCLCTTVVSESGQDLLPPWEEWSLHSGSQCGRKQWFSVAQSCRVDTASGISG